MRVLTGVVFFLNIALWVVSMLIGLVVEPFLIGLPFVIAIISFFIAWNLSGGIVTSPADYFFQPEWTVFKIKMKWSNGVAVITLIISMVLVSLIAGEI